MPHSRMSGTMTLGLVAGVLLASAGLTGCGGGGEERALINRFFTASRLGDRTTAGNIAMMAFDPNGERQRQQHRCHERVRRAAAASPDAGTGGRAGTSPGRRAGAFLAHEGVPGREPRGDRPGGRGRARGRRCREARPGSASGLDHVAAETQERSGAYRMRSAP